MHSLGRNSLLPNLPLLNSILQNNQLLNKASLAVQNKKHFSQSFQKRNLNHQAKEHSLYPSQSSIFAVKKSNSQISLIKTQNRTFLSKIYKGYFQNLELQIIEKEQEYVEVKEPIIFEEEKFIILDPDPNRSNLITGKLIYLAYAIIGFSGYKLGLALYSFAFIRSVFWTVVLFFSLRFRLGIIGNLEHIIKEISVLEDGKTCEITTYKKKFSADINKIRRITIEEALFMAPHIESIKVSYIPIVVESSVYLIPIKSRIHRKDLLSNICDGKYLKFEEIIHKDKTIKI